MYSRIIISTLILINITCYTRSGDSRIAFSKINKVEYCYLYKAYVSEDLKKESHYLFVKDIGAINSERNFAIQQFVMCYAEKYPKVNLVHILNKYIEPTSDGCPECIVMNVSIDRDSDNQVEIGRVKFFDNKKPINYTVPKVKNSKICNYQ